MTYYGSETLQMIRMLLLYYKNYKVAYSYLKKLASIRN